MRIANRLLALSNSSRGKWRPRQLPPTKTPLPTSPLTPSSAGFTLIEILLVIVLVAVISTLAAGRIDTLVQWKQEGDLRKFRNTWESMFSESLARGESYRLVIDLDRNTYYVRREIPPDGTEVKQVDYLANLRTRGERERRSSEAADSLPSLEEEYKDEDQRQSGALDGLFYRTMFADPAGGVTLGRPLEFPNLAEPVELTQGLAFKAVVLRGERIERGSVAIRFTPRGAGEFATVHMAAGEDLYTLVNNPASGKVRMHSGDIKFSWTPRNTDPSTIGGIVEQR